MTYQSMRGRQIYLRVGPSELSIADPAAFRAIHAPTSSCGGRGPYYTITAPIVSLQSTRDKKYHTRRRNAWDKGFSKPALRNYDGRVATYADQLLGAVDRGKGQQFDAGKCLNFFTFDIIGDLAFGDNFSLMNEDREHPFFKAAHKNLIVMGLFGVSEIASKVLPLLPG